MATQVRNGADGVRGHKSRDRGRNRGAVTETPTESNVACDPAPHLRHARRPATSGIRLSQAATVADISRESIVEIRERNLRRHVPPPAALVMGCESDLRRRE